MRVQRGDYRDWRQESLDEVVQSEAMGLHGSVIFDPMYRL